MGAISRLLWKFAMVNGNFVATIVMLELRWRLRNNHIAVIGIMVNYAILVNAKMFFWVCFHLNLNL